jgi:fructokinase
MDTVLVEPGANRGSPVIVVSGEALMDVFAGSDTPGGLTLDARVGGSPFNVAVGLARLRQPVTFFGAVSTDLLGERLMRAMQQDGVDVGALVRVDAPSTLSLVGLDACGVPSYAFYGEGGADRMLPASALERLPSARTGARPRHTPSQAPCPRAFHVGSYSLVVEPVASTLRALAEREHPHSVIAYDPNVRLRAEPSLDRWRAAMTWMKRRTHLLKISHDDLELLSPGVAPATVAAEWLQAGAALVVVTRGAEGASAWTAAHQVRVDAAPATVIDTVGAGDAFQAALLARLAERGLLMVEDLRLLSLEALHDVLDFATRAAGITCSRTGADLPRREELDRA